MQEENRELKQIIQKRQHRRQLAIALGICSICVMMLVFWRLILPGIALSDKLICNQEEHRHTDSCYEKVLTCTNTEEGHVHTDACYEKRLICTIPEHVHTESCYESQEEANESDHTEGAVEENQSEADRADNTETSDTTADVESEEQWKQSFASVQLNENKWTDNVIAIAATQVGYTESTRNFVLSNDEKKGYTRYGDFDGNAYEDWNLAFVNFCLTYAGVDNSAFPIQNDLNQWLKSMKKFKYLNTPDNYEPQPGDIVVLKKADQETDKQVGIISQVVTQDNVTTIYTIEGNCDNQVKENEYLITDPVIANYVSLSTAQSYYEETLKAAQTASAADVPNTVAVPQERDAGQGAGYDFADNVTDVTINPKKDSYNIGDSIAVSINYAISDVSSITEKQNVLYYQLPEGIGIANQQTGTAYDGNHNEIGTYSIGTDGKIQIVVKPEYITTNITSGSQISGNVTFSGKITSMGNGNNGEITFAGSTTPIKVTRDMAISKTGTKQSEDTVSYEIRVTTNSGTGSHVVISDSFANEAGITTSNSDYKVYRVDKNGNKTQVAGQNSFPMTLPALGPGEQYLVDYTSKITDNRSDQGAGALNVKNKATATSGELKKDTEITTNVRDNKIYKSGGSYNPSTGKITWTVQINNNSGNDLAGWTVSDIPGSGKIDLNSVKVTDWNVEVQGGTLTEDGNGFKYTFPAGSTKTGYVIKYETDAPKLNAGDANVSINNKATLSKDGDKFHSENKVDIYYKDWGMYKNCSKGNIGSDEVNENNKITTREWNVSISLPQEDTTSVIYEDVIYDIKDNDNNVIAGTHYGTVKAIKDAIESSIRVDYKELDKNKYEIAYEFFDQNGNSVTGDNDKVQKFKVTIKTKDSSKITAAGFTFNYPTTIDMSDADLGNQYFIKNQGEVNNVKRDSTITYNPPSPGEKPEKPSNPDFKKDIIKANEDGSYIIDNGTQDYLENDGILTYRIFLSGKDAAGKYIDAKDIIITDTMDQGMELVEGSVKGYFSYSENGNGTSNGLIPDSKPFLTYSKESDTKIVFGFNDDWLSNQNRGTYAQWREYYVIEYQVSIKQDVFWKVNKDKVNDKSYTNKVTWDDKEASETTLVKREYDELEKSSTQLKDKDNKWSNQVKYDVVINPMGADLIEGKAYLDLEDTMIVAGKGTAEVNIDEIHLYSYDENAEGKKGEELNKRLYTVTYDKQSGLLKVKVPDELACVLEYGVTVVVEDLTNPPILNNSIQLGQKYSSEDKMNIAVSESSASLIVKKVEIYKVDSDNHLYRLPGAEFKLEKWSENKFVPVEGSLFKTDDNGKINITSIATADVLYRITETKAPENYKLDESPYYFILQKTLTDSALNNLLNSASVQMDSVEIFTSTGGSIMIEDEYEGIQLTKNWLDKDGKELSNTPNEITCTLYKSKEGDYEGFNLKVVSNKLLWNDEVDSYGSTEKNFVVKEGTTVTILLGNGMTDVNCSVIGMTLNKKSETEYEFTPNSSATNGTIIFSKKYNPPNINSTNPSDWDAGVIQYTKAEVLNKQLVGEITLSKASNWTTKLDNLEAGYVYSIEETMIDKKPIDSSKWTVTYRNNDGIAHGEISITNRLTEEEDYVLPETGGIGTGFFFIGGLLLMGGAFFIGFYRNLKERRAYLR